VLQAMTFERRAAQAQASWAKYDAVDGRLPWVRVPESGRPRYRAGFGKPPPNTWLPPARAGVCLRSRGARWRFQN